MKNSLNTVQYAFFGFNWIVGFGFISALSVVSKLGPWVFLCFIIAAFVAFITMIVFARAAEEYAHIAGGTYGYTKLVFGRVLTFFKVGINLAIFFYYRQRHHYF